jgi:hypothetical protein
MLTHPLQVVSLLLDRGVPADQQLTGEWGGLAMMDDTPLVTAARAHPGRQIYWPCSFARSA